MTITQGLDLFETIEQSTSFLFPNFMPIPAGFFGEGSEPWMGTIHLEGYPLREVIDPRTKKRHKIRRVDTVVQRNNDVTINKIGESGTSDIELVQLSLRSVRPIKVNVGGEEQLWDAYLSVSPSARSVGSITFTQTSPTGGVIASQLQVTPLVRFEHRADGTEKVLDMGAAKMPVEKQKQVAEAMTLRTSEVAFQNSPPASAQNIAALTGNMSVVGANLESSQLARHGVHTVLQ